MTAEAAYEILDAMAEIHDCKKKLKKIVPNDVEVKEEELAKDLDTETSEKAERFSFAKCNISVGEEIEFYADSSKKCRVVDERTVEYEGKNMSLTALAKLLTGKKYALAGPKFFKYKGEYLNDIRCRLGV